MSGQDPTCQMMHPEAVVSNVVFLGQTLQSARLTGVRYLGERGLIDRRPAFAWLDRPASKRSIYESFKHDYLDLRHLMGHGDPVVGQF